MLRALGQPVATCCDMLGVVGSSLKLVKFEPTTPNISQHIATGWPNARNMLHPTMLRYVVLACCDRLARALQRKQNNWTAKSTNLEENAGKIKSVFVIGAALWAEKLGRCLELKKYPRKTCGYGQPRGHLIRVLNERSVNDGGDFCLLSLVILKSSWYSVGVTF